MKIIVNLILFCLLLCDCGGQSGAVHAQDKTFTSRIGYDIYGSVIEWVQVSLWSAYYDSSPEVDPQIKAQNLGVGQYFNNALRKIKRSVSQNILEGQLPLTLHEMSQRKAAQEEAERKRKRDIISYSLIFGGSVVFLLLLIAGPTTLINIALMGRWVAENSQLDVGSINEMELLPSGLIKRGAGVMDGQEVTWKAERGRLYIFYSSRAQVYSYKKTGSTLMLTDDRGKSFKYKKLG